LKTLSDSKRILQISAYLENGQRIKYPGKISLTHGINHTTTSTLDPNATMLAPHHHYTSSPITTTKLPLTVATTTTSPHHHIASQPPP
jgi:hypothetical protein